MVKFIKGRFVLVYDGGTSEEMEEDLYRYLDKLEVIGNIYENKELLCGGIE